LTAKCPKCGNEVLNPGKAFRNRIFEIEAYKCQGCGTDFKITIEGLLLNRLTGIIAVAKLTCAIAVCTFCGLGIDLLLQGSWMRF
jgi:hypothetical protein